MGYPKYGGIGGKGGDVILRAEEGNLTQNWFFFNNLCLLSFLIYTFIGATFKSILNKYPNKLIKGKVGSNSHQTCILGKQGENAVICVPPGVQVINDKYQIIGMNSIFIFIFVYKKH